METTTPFSDFKLSAALLNSLGDIGFKNASPIQELTLNHILEGKDIFAQAETGSGKTGAFAIPIIEQILREEGETAQAPEDKLIQYVTLSPTRELAQQTHKVFNDLGQSLGIHAACLIGGESIDKQKTTLKKGTRVLIATPGRLVDLIKQKSVKLDEVKAVVFDEADRLFDMGFQKDIEFILSKVNDNRQLIMVSATSNMEVLKTCYKFKSHPVELKLNEDSLLVDNINHSLAMITQKEKMPFLVNLLRKNTDVYAIIFCNTQIQTHLVAEWLRLMDFKAKPISGRLPQNKRTKLMEEFRSKEVTILVCTDVAARGLDVKDVNLVINFDLPQEAANYVHRIGRTGRAGKSGQAISFCAHEDCEYLDDIYKYIDGKIPKLDVQNEDVKADIVPKPYIDGKTLQLVDRNSSQGNRDRKRDGDSRSKNNRDKNKDMSTKNQEPSKYDAPLERALPTPLKKFVKSEEEKRDRRFFIFTSETEDDANRAALGYYMITDETLLKKEIVSKGSKRYFFFGPRKTTYRYSLDNHYKRLLLPFIIEVLTLSHLDVRVKVAFKGETIEVSFNGPDEGLMLRNRAEMLQSFEQIMRLYLANKITLPSKLRWVVKVAGQKTAAPAKERDNNRARPQQNGRDQRRTRSPEKDKEREEKILKIAQQAKETVLSTKEPYTLKPLDPRDRRIVHQLLSEDPEVKTTSLGDGRLKKIEVSIR
ncbi:MAG: DEAD/DEAH box helicase [Bacteriovoracaceae bacterium]|nr:DEAD/DEAH box helicase [Bacteriovoracaceae bacterium]